MRSHLKISSELSGFTNSTQSRAKLGATSFLDNLDFGLFVVAIERKFKGQVGLMTNWVGLKYESIAG